MNKGEANEREKCELRKKIS